MRIATWLAAALVGPAGLVRADVEFIGLLVTTQKSLFALSDTETHRSEWVALGKSFGGYTVVDFEKAADTLILRKSTALLRVPLKPDAKTKPTRLDLQGKLEIGLGDSMEVVRAAMPFDQETVIPLKDGLVFRVTPTRLPDGNIRFRTAFERTLADGKTERLSSPSVIVLPGQPFAMKVGELGFSFSPTPP